MVPQFVDTMQMDADQIAAVTLQILFMSRDAQAAVDFRVADIMPVTHALAVITLQEKTDRLINEFEAPAVVTKTDDLVTVEDIDGMNPVQKNELLNVLIDRGISKSLSANDQKLLKKLSS